jgi:hypothetical protein
MERAPREPWPAGPGSSQSGATRRADRTSASRGRENSQHGRNAGKAARSYSSSDTVYLVAPPLGTSLGTIVVTT